MFSYRGISAVRFVRRCQVVNAEWGEESRSPLDGRDYFENLEPGVEPAQHLDPVRGSQNGRLAVPKAAFCQETSAISLPFLSTLTK